MDLTGFYVKHSLESMSFCGTDHHFPRALSIRERGANMGNEMEEDGGGRQNKIQPELVIYNMPHTVCAFQFSIQ